MQCFCCQILFLFLSFLSTAKGNLDNDYVCNNAFGLENRQVKDSQLSASSYVPNLQVFDKTYRAKAKYGRLNGKVAWCGQNPTRRSRDKSPFFQVHFLETVKVSGLSTQGLPSSYSSYYVKSYVVKFSLDGHRWFSYSSPNKVWSANNDPRTIQRVFFQKPVRTKFLRVYPLTYNDNMCLRVEVYGCDVNGTVNTQPTSMSQPSSLQPRTSPVTRTAQSTVSPNTTAHNQPTKDSTTSLPTGFPVSQNTTTQTQPIEDSTIVHPTESSVSQNTTTVTKSTTVSPNQPTKDFTTLGFKSTVCNNAFGLENRQVKDSQLSASSYVPNLQVFDKTYRAKAKYGRLNGKVAWCGQNPTRRSRDKSPFFQVHFLETVKVSGLSTQGLPSSYSSYYVKSYVVKFSLDGHHWFNYSSPNKVWSANNDPRTIQRVFFQKPVRTKFLRVYPLTYNDNMCLRVEVYGCDVNGTVKTQPTSMSQPSSLQPRTSPVTRTAQSTVSPNTAAHNQPTDSTTLLPTGFPVLQNTTTQTQPTKDFTTLGFKSSHMPNVFNSTLPTNTLLKPRAVPSYETGTLTSSNTISLLYSRNITKNKIIIVVVICIGFVVLLVLSFIVFLVLKMKKRKEASFIELQVLNNVDGDIEDECFLKALESKSSKWV